MKIVKSAMLTQTVHFPLKTGMEHSAALRLVEMEVDRYKLYLRRNCSKTEIIDEQTQPDGSIILHTRKKLGVVQGWE